MRYATPYTFAYGKDPTRGGGRLISTEYTTFTEEWKVLKGRYREFSPASVSLAGFYGFSYGDPAGRPWKTNFFLMLG
jgi:hypothetical protein